MCWGDLQHIMHPPTTFCNIMTWFLQCAGIMACPLQLQHAQQALNLFVRAFHYLSVLVGLVQHVPLCFLPEVNIIACFLQCAGMA